MSTQRVGAEQGQQQQQRPAKMQIVDSLMQKKINSSHTNSESGRTLSEPLKALNLPRTLTNSRQLSPFNLNFDDDDVNANQSNHWHLLHYKHQNQTAANNNTNAHQSQIKFPYLNDYDDGTTISTTTTTFNADLGNNQREIDEQLFGATTPMYHIERQHELLNLFKTHFKLDSIMAKIITTNEKLSSTPNYNQNVNNNNYHMQTNWQPFVGHSTPMVSSPFSLKQINQNSATHFGTQLQQQQHHQPQQQQLHYDHLAQLSCDSGEMIIRLNFTEPFKGIVYPDHNRLSPCRFFGDGHHNYELRLPLRGCGTKQVAQRVFVNDVTVRFHKTLELEEDEVKTLICRYPPPKEAGNQLGSSSSGSGYNNSQQGEREQTFGGAGAAVKGLGHELEPATFNGANRTLEPFELVDPISGRPTSRFGEGHTLGAAGGAADPLGALVAPSSGGRGHHQSSSTLPGKGSEAYYQQQQDVLAGNTINQRQRLNLLDRQRPNLPPPLVNTNSRLFDPLVDLPSSNNQTTGVGNFFDRLTSVELLFLISALMFLVLLALGLLASYYCFWWRRRRGRRGLDAPTVAGRGALMRHKRRYFNPPLQSVSGSRRDMDPLAQAASSLSPAFGPSGQHNQYLAPSMPTSSQHQLLQSQYQARPALYYHHYLQQQQQQQQQQQMGAPSSPDDSDISGRVLLPPAGRGGRSISRQLAAGAQSLRRPLGPTEDTTSTMAYDTGLLRHQNNNHYKSAALLAPPGSGTTVMGRRNEQLSAAAGYGGSSTLGRRAGGGGDPSGYFSTNLRSSSGLNSHYNKRQQEQQPLGRVQVLPLAGLGAKSSTLGRGVSARQPLLKMAGTPPHSNEEDYYEDDGDNEPLVYANQQRIGAPQNQYRNQEQQRVRQPGKNLQQLGRVGEGELLAWHRHQDQLDRLTEERGQERLQVRQEPVLVNDATGLVYGKQRLRYDEDDDDDDNGVGQNQLYRKHWQRQMAPPRMGTNEARIGDDKIADTAGRRLVNVECSSPSSSSSSSSLPGDGGESKLNNNHGDGAKQPRLILKSIEDSFVTNFIEVHEQEYKKYDTTRPISWAEWASKQPTRASSTTKQSGGGTGGAGAGAGAADSGGKLGNEELGSSLGDGCLTSTDHREQHSSEEPHSSAANCLRSLTELDVNFAKSLPRPHHQQRTIEQSERASGEGSGAVATRGTTNPTQQSVAGGSVPGVKVSSPPTPDLVISPDYNFDRYKLVGGGTSQQSGHQTSGDKNADKRPKERADGDAVNLRESHGSISYV